MEYEFQLKKMKCEFGHLSRPDGSALFASGNSLILAAVYGPCEVKPQKMLIDKATIEVIYKPKSGLPSISDKLKESVLLNVCKSAILSTEYPRSLISITVQEMQTAGTLLSTSINGACLALIDSGIAMRFLVAAVTCIINANGEFTLDPDAKEMKDSKAVFMMVFESINNNVVASKIEGEFTNEEFEKAFETCCKASCAIFQFYRVIVCKGAQTIVAR